MKIPLMEHVESTNVPSVDFDIHGILFTFDPHIQESSTNLIWFLSYTHLNIVMVHLNRKRVLLIRIGSRREPFTICIYRYVICK